MIEQTPLVVDEWIYIPLIKGSNSEQEINSFLTLEVMKKSTLTKKGLACRYSAKFICGNDVILLYVAQDSYVIDLADKIDKQEILRMIKNSYSKFNETFELRKLGTLLQNESLKPFDEANTDIDAIVPLLN